MNRFTNFSTLHFASIALVISSATALPAYAQSPVTSETLIRPGVGVGRVRLGMMRSKVKAILGKPETQFPHGLYEYYSELNVFYKRNRVIIIEVKSSRFRTAEGLSLRSRLTQIRQRFAPLSLIREDPFDIIALSYSNATWGIGFCFQGDEPKRDYTNSNDRMMNAFVSNSSRMLGIGVFRPGTKWKMLFSSH